MEIEDSYNFYFLDEDILNDIKNEIKTKKDKIKAICTVGNINKYDSENKYGYIFYNGYSLFSSFSRVSNKIQLDQEGIYFFYGFIQNCDNDAIFICEYIDSKPTKNFNRQEYEKYLNNKRRIIEECKKMISNK